jgi:hypothetical protein
LAVRAELHGDAGIEELLCAARDRDVVEVVFRPHRPAP